MKTRRGGRGGGRWPGGRLVVCILALAVLSGPATSFAGDATADEAALHRLRSALAVTLMRMGQRDELFPAVRLDAARVLALEARAEARRVWVSVYDRLLALDALARAHGEFSGGARGFALHHAASLAHYRYALDFIERTERDPGLDAVLNEADPALGLPADSYRALKDEILHPARAGAFASRRLVDRVAISVEAPGLEAATRSDADRIWEMGRRDGPLLTARHLAQRAGGAGAEAALPVQEGVARRMAEIRVRRVGSALITEHQIAGLRAELRPGDVLLTRREWYVSNVGIPGFWSHTALYVGDGAERGAYFDTPAVRSWVVAQGEASGDFERLLAATRPEAHRRASDSGPPPARVLEAIAEGVAFTPLERAAHADSIAVLRPRLDRVTKARAVWRAFHYAGRPYDYHFDFRSDQALVCSELVYKAYRELPGEAGLALPLERTLGRPMMTPNTLAQIFSEEGTQRFELVVFLDGDERAGVARESTPEAFKTSWSRPKWHILLPVDEATLPAAEVPPAASAPSEAPEGAAPALGSQHLME